MQILYTVLLCLLLMLWAAMLVWCHLMSLVDHPEIQTKKFSLDFPSRKSYYDMNIYHLNNSTHCPVALLCRVALTILVSCTHRVSSCMSTCDSFSTKFSFTSYIHTNHKMAQSNNFHRTIYIVRFSYTC